MKSWFVACLIIGCITTTALTACGASSSETLPPEKPPAATPLPATQKPPVPAMTVTSSGPVLDADGKPVLFPDGVPVPLPADLKPYNLTYYGYQTSAMQKFVPENVFKDKAKYTDSDRENARLALKYILDSLNTQEAAQGAAVNENVYSWHLLARIHTQLYYDKGDEKELEKALQYFEKCREKKYAASIKDHQALLLFAGRELPDEWK